MFDPSAGRPKVNLKRYFLIIISLFVLTYYFKVGCIAVIFLLFWMGFLIFRHQKSPYLKLIAEVSLPIAVGLTPHFLFVASYNAQYEHEESSLAQAYESGVITLHAWLKPLDDVHCPLLILILILTFYVSTVVRSDLPIALYVSSRQYLSRAMLFLTAALSFTVLTNSATGNWSPDIEARFVEKDRDRVTADAKLAVVDRLASDRVGVDDMRSAVHSLNALVDRALSQSRSIYASAASSNETVSAKERAAARLAQDIVHEASSTISMDAVPSAPVESGNDGQDLTLQALHERSSAATAARERAATRTEALVSLISADLPFDTHEVVKRFIDELAGDSAQELLTGMLKQFDTPAWDAVDRMIQHRNDAFGRSLSTLANRIAERCAAFTLSGGRPSKSADPRLYDLGREIASDAAKDIETQVRVRIDPHPPKPEPKVR